VTKHFFLAARFLFLATIFLFIFLKNIFYCKKKKSCDKEKKYVLSIYQGKFPWRQRPFLRVKKNARHGAQ